MLVMENSEEVLQVLERYSKLKPKDIPKELEDYLCYVARTGDTLYRWFHVKILFREKLIRVIKDFHENTPSIDDLPQYPNVDPFNYESMKSALLERLELFNAAPFTVQRLCELLTDPKKQYNRIDKFMRALEKNILVVSTVEPGRKLAESENGDSLDSVTNGDLSLDVNVEIDMEGGESLFNDEASQTPKKSDISLSNIGGNEIVALSENDERETAKNDIKTSDQVDDKPIIDNPKIESLRLQKELSLSGTIENSEEISLEKNVVIECKVKNVMKLEDNTPHEISVKIEDSIHSICVINKTVESSPVSTNLTASDDKQVDNERNDLTKESTRNIVHNLKLKSALIDLSDGLKETDYLTQKNTSEQLGGTVESPSGMKSVIQPEKSKENNGSLHHEATKGNDRLTTSENIETSLNINQEQMSVEESPSPSNVIDKQVCTDVQIPKSERQRTIPDQLMDDNLENTSQHLTSSSCSEVIMHSETNMTTVSDVKVDTAGMDIDDTSQEEAMDQ